MSEDEWTKAIATMSDAALAKELAFAEGFGPDIADGAGAWLDALRAEAKKRGAA